jgi:acyl dehydratase
MTPDELRARIGVVLGPTAWRTVTQDMVDTFAGLSGDRQWIHVDVARAAAESPFGTTIAHGNLTLAMVDGFRDDLVGLDGVTLGVNLGYDRVRFPAPVRVGSRVRATAELTAVEERGGGWTQTVTRFVVAVDGEERPACVADSVVRVLTA